MASDKRYKKRLRHWLAAFESPAAAATYLKSLDRRQRRREMKKGKGKGK